MCFQVFAQPKVKRLVYIGVPGSKSVAGKRTDFIGTWENHIVLLEAFNKLKKRLEECMSIW